MIQIRKDHPREVTHDAPFYVLTFQTFEHKYGKRYRKGNSQCAVFPTFDDARARMTQLEAHANPDHLDRAYGMFPTSYEYQIYRSDESNTAQYAIAVGTTAHKVNER